MIDLDHRDLAISGATAVVVVAVLGAGFLWAIQPRDEVMSLAHRIVVMRDGKVVADVPSGSVNKSELVGLIGGLARNVERLVAPVQVERVLGLLPDEGHQIDEFGVVVEHFLEMRHEPARVGRIPGEPAAEMIVDAALAHRIEGL